MYATTSHKSHYQIGYKSQILAPGGNFLQSFIDFQLLQHRVVKVSIILVRNVIKLSKLSPTKVEKLLFSHWEQWHALN